jgi:hypothetical protein
MSMASTPVETKVKAATGGSTVGVALAGLILWLLDTYVFTDEPVPDAIVVAVWALLPIGLTFLGGYFAKHTYKPPLPLTAVDRIELEARLVGQQQENLERLEPEFGGGNVALKPVSGGFTGSGQSGILPPPTTRATGAPKMGGDVTPAD